MTIVVSPSNSETTLAQIRSIIQYKGYGSDTAPEIQNSMINSVYRRILGMRNWWFNDEFADTSIGLTAGDGTAALSPVERLHRVDAVRLQYGTEYPAIAYMPPQEFHENYHHDRTVGIPRYWTQVDDELHFWPLPDKAYTIVLDFNKRPATLVNDSDVVRIPEAYVDVLVWGAIKELCFRERDDAGRNYADQEYRDIVQDMKHRDGIQQKQTSSQVGYSGELDEVNRHYV